MSSPVILEIFASVDAVRTTLVSLGATSPDRRSVAFDLADHLVLLGVDEIEESTVVAVGGEDPGPLAQWLVREFADALPGAVHTLSDRPNDGVESPA